VRENRTRTHDSTIRPDGWIHEYLWAGNTNPVIWTPLAKHYDRAEMRYCYDYSGFPYNDTPVNIQNVGVTYSRHISNDWGVSVSWLDCPSPIPDPWIMWWDTIATSSFVNNYMAKAMANANPNSPTVDLPLALFELRELPRLIKETRTILSRAKPDLLIDLPKIGKTNLSYNFGFKPLVDDLLSLIDFVAATDKHLAYLQKLEKSHSVNRKIGTESGVGDLINEPNKIQRPAIAGKNVYVTADDDQSYSWTRDIWYTMKLELTDPLPTSGGDRRALARRLASGLYLNSDTAWNAVPWTWLIDWFTNFGDLISSTRGLLGYEQRDLNLMIHYAAKAGPIAYSTLDNTIQQEGERVLTFDRKLRFVRARPYALPTFYTPAISNHQIGILASLAITGGKRPSVTG